MIVSGCNLSYLPYAKIWLRSVLKHGRVPASQIHVAVIGARPSRLIMETEFRGVSKQVKVIHVEPSDRHFGFLNQDPERRFLNYWFADYLRAWLIDELGPGVWIDADTIVRGSLLPLVKLSRDEDALHIGKEPGQHFKRQYFETYVATHQTMPSVRRDASGPVTYNCGVISAGRSFAREWRREFKKIIELKDPKYLAMLDLGQLVWNLVAWDAEAKLLDPRFNSLPWDPAKDPVISHFAHHTKQQMLEEAVRLRLIG